MPTLPAGLLYNSAIYDALGFEKVNSEFGFLICRMEVNLAFMVLVRIRVDVFNSAR